MSLKPFVRALGRFTPLTNEQSKLVEGLPYRKRFVARRTNAISLGETPSYLYVNLEGWAARYAVRKTASRRITGFFLPGDFCGIHAVCDAEMDHSIFALTPCTIALVELSSFERLVANDPEIGRALWRAKLVDEASLRMWLLNSNDAYSNLAHLICELDVRVGGIGKSGSREVPLPITQEDLGDALDLTSVHVNRTMRKISADGLIQRDSHIVRIPDVAALRLAASFNPTYLSAPTASSSAAAEQSDGFGADQSRSVCK